MYASLHVCAIHYITFIIAVLTWILYTHRITLRVYICMQPNNAEYIICTKFWLKLCVRCLGLESIMVF